MSRPQQPRLHERQAARLRRVIACEREAWSLTNERIGVVFEAHKWATDGKKAVENAMLTERKLTHQTARRLAVALLLALPDPSTAPAEGSVRVGDYEHALCNELYGLLYHFGAFPRRGPAPAAFIPDASVPALADYLAAQTTREIGVGAKLRPRIKRALERALRERAPAMARAFCDNVSSGTFFGPEAAKELELFARSTYRERHVYPTQQEGDLEFDLLARERPVVGACVELPP